MEYLVMDFKRMFLLLFCCLVNNGRDYGFCFPHGLVLNSSWMYTKENSRVLLVMAYPYFFCCSCAWTLGFCMVCGILEMGNKGLEVDTLCVFTLLLLFIWT
jgi:hypothetical protein